MYKPTDERASAPKSPANPCLLPSQELHDLLIILATNPPPQWHSPCPGVPAWPGFLVSVSTPYERRLLRSSRFFEGRGSLSGGSFPKHSEKSEPFPPTSPRKRFSRPPRCATPWSPEVSRVTTRSGRGQGPQSRPAFPRSVCLFLSPRTRQTPSR